MTESTDSTYQTEVAGADNKLDGASTGAAATEALSALNDLKPADRKAFVENASEYLTQNGELPELMLTVGTSRPLQTLFNSVSTTDSAGRLYDPDSNGPDNMGGDQVAKLQAAVDTGELNGAELTLTEQIACDALIKNFNDIQLSVGLDPTDGLISLNVDLLNQNDTNMSMTREMGENRFALTSAVAMFADNQGNFDPSKYKTLFGSDAPIRSDLQNFHDDANGYGKLSPSEKQGVDVIIDRFNDLDMNGDSKLDGAEIYDFANVRNIDYSSPQQHDQIKAKVDAFDEEHTPVADLTKDQVDGLIARLAEPSGDATVFDVLDKHDGNQDGLVSDKALADDSFLGIEATAAKTLAEHIQQFDGNGDGRIFLTELAKGSSKYADAGSQDEIVKKAQDNKAQEIRDQETDTPGDLTDDTKAAMALFGTEDGGFDYRKWNSILAPDQSEDIGEGKGVDVDRNQILTAIRSDKFDTLTPSEQRGLTSLYDNFDQYSNKQGVASTLGPDEFRNAVFDKGIKWTTDEEQRKKIIDDQNAFNAKNATSPDPEVLDTLMAKAKVADPNYLQNKFNDQKDMSSAELSAHIAELNEGDPNRDLMEYISKFHDQLAVQTDDPSHLSLADMDAFIKAGPTKADASDDTDTVALTYWRGGENITDFAAVLNPDNPQQGLDQLLEINNMTYDELNYHFWHDKSGGIVIPADLYERYYGEPYEEDAA